MIVLWLLVGIHAALCTDESGQIGYEPKPGALEIFTPERGYVPTRTFWTKMALKNEITVNVAEFTKPSNKECVRVVHFSGGQEPLAAVEAACDDSPLHTGLLYIGNSLMYYTMATAEHQLIDYLSMKAYSFIGVKDESTCNSAFISLTYDDKASSKTQREETPLQKESNDVCKDMIEDSLVPMGLVSYQDKRSVDTSTLDPIVSLNYGKALGARIYQFKNGLTCYRQLRFYSFDLDLDLALRMTCGPVQEVILTALALYTKDAMITHDSEQDTFTLIINPTKIYEPSVGDNQPPSCIKKTLKLIKDGDRYAKTMQDVVFEYDRLSSECETFLEGHFEGKRSSDRTEAVWMIESSIRINEFNVDKGIQDKLEGYFLVRRNDYNLAHELGIVMLQFKKYGTSSRKTGIFVTARGIVLTGYFSEDITDKVDLDINDGQLYCNENLMAKRSEGNTFTVVIKTNENECAKETYEIEESGEKKKIGNVSMVSEADSDCMSLLSYKKSDKAKTHEEQAQP